MTRIESGRSGPAWRLIGAAALVQAALHAASVGRYGIFRDELYYLSCASRPAAGYVDQPPFSILFLSAWRFLFGDSAASLMVPPALCGVAVVVLTGLLARRFGGGPAAQGLASAAAAVAPIWVGMTGYYSMNSFDILLWTLAATVLAALLGDEPGPRAGRLWLTLGLTLALGLLNKISVLWLGAGIFAGLLLTPARRWLTTLGPWLAGGIAFLGLLPYLAWNALHRWPTLEFMRRATGEKYRATSPLAFGGELLLLFQPLAAPLWIAGLVWLLAARDGRRFRLLGVVFVTTFAILLANRTSKAEYLAAAFAPLLAAGGVALERLLHRGRSAAGAWVYGTLLVLGGVAIAPFALPLLPVPEYLAYAKKLGMGPTTTERNELGPLPQHFADRFGWPEMAAEVARVASMLTAGERGTARVWARNYGEAAALEKYGAPLGVPRVLCPHNSFWFWSVADAEKNAPFKGPLIVIGGTRPDLETVFGRVEEAGKTGHPLAMPYENGRPIWICRDPKEDLRAILQRDRLFI
ncbi:MAG TPA: glycosyltransferase family 39 protein [Thermoanaerobaculia bacterium]|nr:glycosyltransferase family 39 protein [Thermoanaerobaculia bacterium]